jgi:hypothetical protein
METCLLLIKRQGKLINYIIRKRAQGIEECPYEIICNPPGQNKEAT